MKGIPIIRLKLLKRAAILLGAGALVAGTSVLGAAQARASLGTQSGALSFSPSSGPVTTTGITYSTTTACPSGSNGSGVVRLIDPANPNSESASTNLTQVNNNVSAPFSGTFNSSFAIIEQIYPDVVGSVSEVAVYCFSGASATGTAVVAQDTFVQISADGSTYTENPVAPVANMDLIASPATGMVGQSVTLTADISPSSATGSVLFSVNGTAIGAPVTVTSGAATTTTSFAAAGTETLSAVYTPTGSSSGLASTLSYTVSAAPDSDTIPLAVTVPASGAFTLTVDTTDTITLMMNGSTATAMTNPVVVSDTRNTFPGWSLSAQDSNWTGSGAATGATISGNQLGWTPTSSTSPLTRGVALGGTVAPGSPGLGSTPAVLAAVTAGLGNGFGTTTVGADLTLAIPAPQEAGPYTSGLSLTSVSTTP